MISKLIHKNSYSQNDILFWGFSGIAIIAIIASVLLDNIIPMALPIGLIGAYVTVVNTKLVFWGLIMALAFSTEVELPGGLGTDLPGEPLMLLLTAIYLLVVLAYPSKVFIPLKNIITICIILHVTWIFLTTITSENPLVSMKFLLAKIWYVIPFYFAPFLFIKKKKDIKMLIYLLIFSVFISASFVMAKHFSLGLSFDTIEKAVQPIFRNHVNYACLLVVTLPYFWISFRWNRHKESAVILVFAILFILSAIYFSFTRAAIGSVLIGIGAFYILKWKLTKIGFIAAVIGLIGFLGYLSKNNTYMDYAPNFERTITHTNFDNLLEATAKGEDISTMERVYRWLAGVQMVIERPITGYGANNFYPYYKHKTISSFETYVSDNPEKSGIHCYYLMVAVEQGIPGLIIFAVLCFLMLYQAEKIYHRMDDKFYKSIVAAAYVSIMIILSILVVNDLLEADKVGPFFFLAAALIVLSEKYGLKKLE